MDYDLRYSENRFNTFLLHQVLNFSHLQSTKVIRTRNKKNVYKQ